MKHESGNTHALQRWLRGVGVGDAFCQMGVLLSQANQTTAGVFIVDAERNVVMWDEGMESLLGFTSDEMVGNHCLKGNRCDNCMRGCGLAEHGQVSRLALTLHHKNGTPVEILKTGRAFFDGNGVFQGTIEIMAKADGAVASVPTSPSQKPSVELVIPTGGLVDFHGMISGDDHMHDMFGIIRNTAQTEAPVLARGESGSGKELLARAIHAESPRSEGLFVAVNCAALSPTLLESQLFGHIKGAFTGAIKTQDGMFQAADGGTIFLDEVAELPIGLQAKLLRALEAGEVTPVGATKPVSVNVRVVAATHQSLRKAVKEGRFRADLMYRLRVVPLFIPPLRERRGDISILLQRFIGRHNEQGPRVIRTVHPQAMQQLLDHPWPGNVRELLNVVQYAFAVGRGPQMLPREMPPEFREAQEGRASIQAEKTATEAVAIQEALQEAGGNITEAAIILGMSRATFWRKRKKYGI